MTLQSLLLTALFALTAVALIGVLNARGVWRTSIAAVLALFCLVGALWQLNAARAAKALGVSGLEGGGGLTGLYGVSGSAEAGQQTEDAAGAGDMEQDTWGEGTGNGANGLTGDAQIAPLAELVTATRALLDSLSGEDPSKARALNDSDYQAFERRTESYVSRARQLRERAVRLSAAPPSSPSSAGWEDAAESLNQSLQSLITASRDLRAFFRATGRDEEQRLIGVYRKGLETATGSLRRAESGAAALAPDPSSPDF